MIKKVGFSQYRVMFIVSVFGCANFYYYLLFTEIYKSQEKPSRKASKENEFGQCNDREKLKDSLVRQKRSMYFQIYQNFKFSIPLLITTLKCGIENFQI